MDRGRFARGDRFGDLEIERELGCGAFGRVYLARDTLIDRLVALKVVQSFVAGDEHEQRQVLREARAIGRLSHPHIVTLYRVHAPDEGATWMFEMEYVEGGTLRERLGTDRSLPHDQARALGHQVGLALAAAHAAGVVHGDVKAGNVLLGKAGSPKLADFGLARVLGDMSHSLSSSIPGAGTPVYMAPEVVMGEAVTSASDLWSFGVLLYRILEGRLPFDARNLNVLFHAIQHAAPRPLGPAVPRPLADLVLACLSKSPHDRPARWDDVLAVLEAGSGAGARVRPPATVPAGEGLVGREVERRQLSVLLGAAEGGEGAVVLVTGPLGVGKSALLHATQAVAAARGFLWVPAAVTPVRGLLRPLLEAARAARDHEPSLGEDDDALFGSAAGIVRRLLDEEATVRLETRSQTLWALEQLLLGIARNRHTVVVVEDAHHADAEDARVLRHLARTLPAKGVLLIVVARSEASTPGSEGVGVAGIHDLAPMPQMVRLEVGPLGREETLLLVRDWARGSQVAPEIPQRVFDLSQGNPLFARELLKHLVETRGIVREEDALRLGPAWQGAKLPRRIRELALGRIRTLAESDRALVDMAAVDGVEFEGEALAASLGEPLLDVLRRLQRLYRATGIVVPGERGFRFANALFQEAVYEDLAPPLRRALHLELAQHLAQRGEVRPERLGLHWEMAGRHEQAVPLLVEAAHRAALRQEFLRAIEFARLAGIVPGSGMEPFLEHSDAVLRLAYCHRATGRVGECESILADLMEVARRRGRDELRLRAAVLLINARYFSRGSAAVDEETLQEAVASLPPCAELGSALYLLGMMAKYRSELREAEQRFREADELFSTLGLRSQHASATDQLASVALRRGRLPKAQALYEEAASIAAGAGQPANAALSHVNASLAAMRRGRLKGLEDTLTRCVHTLEMDGAGQYAAHSTVVLATVRYAKGDRPGAEAAIREALATLAGGTFWPALAPAHFEAAHLACAGGDVASARTHLASAIASAEKGQDREVLAKAAALETHLCCLQGDPGGAGRAARRACEVARAQSESHVLGDTALWLAEATLYGLPPSHLEEVADLVGGDPLVSSVVDAFAALATTGAAAALTAGSNLLSDPPFGERKALWAVIARIFGAAASRDAEAARSSLREAQAMARDLGHRPLEEAIRHRLADLPA